MKVGGNGSNIYARQMIAARVALQNSRNGKTKATGNDSDGGNESAATAETKRSAQSAPAGQTGSANQRRPIDALPIPNVSQAKAKGERGGGEGGPAANGAKGNSQPQQANTYGKTAGQTQQGNPAEKGAYLNITA
jgi:hypothetical protein